MCFKIEVVNPGRLRSTLSYTYCSFVIEAAKIMAVESGGGEGGRGALRIFSRASRAKFFAYILYIVDSRAGTKCQPNASSLLYCRIPLSYHTANSFRTHAAKMQIT